MAKDKIENWYKVSANIDDLPANVKSAYHAWLEAHEAEKAAREPLEKALRPMLEAIAPTATPAVVLSYRYDDVSYGFAAKGGRSTSNSAGAADTPLARAIAATSQSTRRR